MDKIIFTDSLLTNNSTLEDLKYHFNSKNINMFDFLNDSYEITTNINDQINKITVQNRLFFNFFKFNTCYNHEYSKLAVEIFIKNKLLEKGIDLPFKNKNYYSYIKPKKYL